MTDGKTSPTEAARPASVDLKLEMEVISGSAKLFGKLAPERVEPAYFYLGNVLGAAKMSPAGPAAKGDGSSSFKSGQHKAFSKSNITYGSLAELYNAARPETGWQKVLVGGYWFQVCEGSEEFTAQIVNDQLKEIGAKVANVTVAFNTLKAFNPSLVLQVRKMGKAQQARKQYKLTVAGIRAVEELIGREA
jgi:hypothetical protein